MKQIATIFVLLSLCTISLGQDTSSKVNILQGPTFKVSKKIDSLSVIGMDDTGFYLVFAKRNSRNQYDSYSIAKADKSLKVGDMIDLEDKKRDGGLEFEAINYFGDELNLFSSYHDRMGTNISFYKRKLDKTTMLPAEDKVKLFEVALNGNNGRANAVYPRFYSDDDKQTQLAKYHTSFEKEEPMQLNFHLYDKNLKELWQASVELPYINQEISLKKVIHSDDGRIYILANIRDESGASKKGRYTVFALTDKANTVKEYSIDSGQKIIDDMHMEISPQDKIICAGFSRQPDYYNGASGLTFIAIDSNGEGIELQKSLEFSTEFITQHLTEKSTKKTVRAEEKDKNIGIEHLHARSMILKNDGSIILIGEQYWTGDAGVGGTGNPNSTSTYNDIIVVSISPEEGEIQWSQKVPKRQYNSLLMDKYSSFAQFVVDDNVHFIFNDNSKNLDHKEGSEWKRMNLAHHFVALVSVDSDGNVTRDDLYAGTKNKLLNAKPKIHKQIGENEFLFYSGFRTDNYLSKITFVQ